MSKLYCFYYFHYFFIDSLYCFLRLKEEINLVANRPKKADLERPEVKNFKEKVPDFDFDKLIHSEATNLAIRNKFMRLKTNDSQNVIQLSYEKAMDCNLKETNFKKSNDFYINMGININIKSKKGKYIFKKVFF